MFLHKSQRAEGFFNKFKRREGVMGKSALSPSSSRRKKQGRGKIGAAALGGAWPAAPGPRRRLGVGEIGQGGAGDRFPPLI